MVIFKMPDEKPPYLNPPESNEDNSADGVNSSEQISSQINARNKIIDILTRVDTRHSFTDKLLDREIEVFSGEDRGLITEVVNGVLRWRFRLDWYLSHLYVGQYENLIPDVKNNLRSSVYQLMYLDKIPPYAVLNEAVEIAKKKFNQKTANLINAILRNYLRQGKKLKFVEMQLDYLERLCVVYSHPLWLVQRWIEQWGVDDAIKLCQYNNERPTISIRLNHLLADAQSFFKIMDENNIAYEAHPDFPEFIWISDFSEFRKLDFMQKGWVSVQDVSTGIPVRLLNPQPGEKVLDMCAAPGGKSGYIAEKMHNQGLLISMEKHPNRASQLRDNLKRWNARVAFVIAADAINFPVKEKFDKVLLDAPCTGFGVLNKRVDLRWKRSLQDIENLQRLQLKLLEIATEVLEINGVIVYSTCTIETDENERVVEKFLQNHPEFELENLAGEFADKYLWNQTMVRTFPHRHDMDGTFAVRLRKHPR
jgi:16S rRNA (cytosine967-C5)-methyltransferase